jgi:hypothetical protein
MMVTVGNYYTVSGTITLAGGNPKLEGTVVSCSGMGVADTTDEAGTYALSGLDCGTQLITISRNVYETLDTLMTSMHDTTLTVMLGFGEYSCGDANGDGGVNVGDAVFVINHVFKGGPSPDPVLLGDANCDEACNVGDAVYLINHVFKGGAEPCPNCLEPAP